MQSGSKKHLLARFLISALIPCFLRLPIKDNKQKAERSPDGRNKKQTFFSSAQIPVWKKRAAHECLLRFMHIWPSFLPLKVKLCVAEHHEGFAGKNAGSKYTSNIPHFVFFFCRRGHFGTEKSFTDSSH